MAVTIPYTIMSLSQEYLFLFLMERPYGTLQKGYEVFKGALLNGSKSIVRDSVKNWDRLYEVRESMRGNEHLYSEQAKEHLLPIKDKTRTAQSHTNENVKEKTRTLITVDKAREIGSKAVTFRDGLYMKNPVLLFLFQAYVFLMLFHYLQVLISLSVSMYASSFSVVSLSSLNTS